MFIGSAWRQSSVGDDSWALSQVTFNLVLETGERSRVLQASMKSVIALELHLGEIT
jgi:hypothetical protein